MIRAFVIAAICGIAVASSAHAQGMSPGPLAKDHAALEGNDNCVRCHSGGDQISPTLCLSCHKALGQRIAAKAGYHATVGNDCATCHPDHRGVGADLVRWKGGRDKFDHDTAGYKLAGGHAKVACRDCHKVGFLSGGVATALTADEKPRTYLGLGTSCATCHKDIHSPSLGSDCQRCHTAVSWHTTTTGFDHAKTKYPLIGAHIKVDCVKCHAGTAQKLGNFHPAFDTCQTCHKDPHATAMGDAKACATCHRETAWKESHYDPKKHAPRTLPLTAGHAKPACAACHGDKLDRKPPPTCTPCHVDAHKPSLGSRCESCHQTQSWTKAAPPKSEFHDKTAYPLRGLHTTVTCDQCHDPKKPNAKRYRPIAHGKCLDCHADPHAGEADKPCESCHAVDIAWKPARFEIADHAKTKFALDGAHRAVPCAKCHPSAPKPPGFRQGNPPCETCHADPHAGQFKAKGTCASCHGVVAWSPSTFTKDAHAKAGFPIAGKHDVACGRCHAKQFVGVATECSACHDDRHAGQFASQKCTECHAGAEWKPTPGFDHAKTFVLRGRHAKAECTRCHPKSEIQLTPTTSLDFEVYKLGPASHDCIGCHRSQHGDPKSGIEQRRVLATATHNCQTCHVETEWRTITVGVQFEHSTTGAPLVGGHASTPCKSCHNATRRTVPKLVECASCHQDRHSGRLGDRCERCHSAATWKQDQLLVDHQRTRLPLAGAHAVQGCPTCHKDAQAGIYRGLDPTCRSCHIHTVEERRPHPDHTKDLAFNPCENCHSVLGWRPAHIDHDKFWPLTGKHQTTPCDACHKPGDPYSAAPTQCIGCHQKDLTSANDGHVPGHDTYGTSCGDCHNTTTWKGATFKHDQYPINHHNATCVQCHTTPNMPQLYTCTSAGCHNSTQTPKPGRGHKGGSQDCARGGCHFGGANGGD